MGFSRQEYWGGLLCPPPGIFLTQGSILYLLCLLHWHAGSLPLALPRKSSYENNDGYLGGLMSEAHTYMEGAMLPLFGKDSWWREVGKGFCSQSDLRFWEMTRGHSGLQWARLWVSPDEWAQSGCLVELNCGPAIGWPVGSRPLFSFSVLLWLRITLCRC